MDVDTIPGFSLDLVTRFVEPGPGDISPTLFRTIKLDRMDRASIFRLDDDYKVYNALSKELKRGWNGKVLNVFLEDPYTDIDTYLMRAIEDGILLVRDRPALIWNSQRVYVYSKYARYYFKHIGEDEIRRLSPRKTEIECVITSSSSSSEGV